MYISMEIMKLREAVNKEQQDRARIERLEAVVGALASKLAGFLPAMQNDMAVIVQTLNTFAPANLQQLQENLTENEIKDLFEGRGPVAREVSKFLQLQQAFISTPLPEGFSYNYEGKFLSMFFNKLLDPRLDKEDFDLAINSIRKTHSDLYNFCMATKNVPSNIISRSGDNDALGITLHFSGSDPYLSYNLEAEGRTIHDRELRFIAAGAAARLAKEAKAYLQQHNAFTDAEGNPLRDETLITDLIEKLKSEQPFFKRAKENYEEIGLELTFDKEDTECRIVKLTMQYRELVLTFGNEGFKTLNLAHRCSSFSPFEQVEDPHPYMVNYMVMKMHSLYQAKLEGDLRLKERQEKANNNPF